MADFSLVPLPGKAKVWFQRRTCASPFESDTKLCADVSRQASSYVHPRISTQLLTPLLILGPGPGQVLTATVMQG